MTIVLELIAAPFLLAALTALYAVPGVLIAHYGLGHYPPLRWKKFYPADPKMPVAEELHPTLKKLFDASDVLINMP